MSDTTEAFDENKLKTNDASLVGQYLTYSPDLIIKKKQPESFFITFHEALRELKGPFNCSIFSSVCILQFLDSIK